MGDPHKKSKKSTRNKTSSKSSTPSTPSTSSTSSTPDQQQGRLRMSAPLKRRRSMEELLSSTSSTSSSTTPPPTPPPTPATPMPPATPDAYRREDHASSPASSFVPRHRRTHSAAARSASPSASSTTLPRSSSSTSSTPLSLAGKQPFESAPGPPLISAKASVSRHTSSASSASSTSSWGSLSSFSLASTDPTPSDRVKPERHYRSINFIKNIRSRQSRAHQDTGSSVSRSASPFARSVSADNLAQASEDSTPTSSASNSSLASDSLMSRSSLAPSSSNSFAGRRRSASVEHIRQASDDNDDHVEHGNDDDDDDVARVSSELSLGQASTSSKVAPASTSLPSDSNEVWSIERLAAMMFGNGAVPLSSRAGYFGLYEPCFIGSEAVDWLTANMHMSREEAVIVMMSMMQRGIICHVTNSRSFEDNPSFYYYYVPSLPEEKVSGLLEVIVKEGMLKVKGLFRFAKRVCTLYIRPSELRFFDPETMERKGLIDLRCVCNIDFQQGTSGEFKLSTFSEDHVLMAENKEAAVAWVTAIKRVIAAAQRPRFESRFGEQTTASDTGAVETVLVRRSTKVALQKQASASASVTPTASSSSTPPASTHDTPPATVVTPATPRSPLHQKAASLPVFRSDEDTSSISMSTLPSLSTASTASTATTSTTVTTTTTTTTTSSTEEPSTPQSPVVQLNKTSTRIPYPLTEESVTETSSNSSSTSSLDSTASRDSTTDQLTPRSQSTPEIGARSASSSVLLTGNLKKREGMTLGSTWRKRYCVLVDAPYRELRYYDSQQTSLAKEIIDVTAVVEAEPVLEAEKPEFVVSTGRTRYHFRCKTETERDEWVAAIRKVIVNWSMRNVLNFRKPTRHRNSKQRPSGELALRAMSRQAALLAPASPVVTPHALPVNPET